MGTSVKMENIEELLSMPKKDLEKVFEHLTLSDIEDLISKFKEEVK